MRILTVMEKDPEKIENLKIRKMSREEVEFAIEMAAFEGWNPGIHDGELFYEADKEGFFVAEIGGKPVGCASAVAYDNDFGFLGLYVVKPGLQNKGIGMKLTEKCLEHLGDRNIGLDGVVENEEKYQKVMKFKSSYSNLRFEGRGGGEIPNGLVKIPEVPFEKLLEYDRRMFPAPRSGFLKKWVNQPDSYAFAALEAGDLKGSGTWVVEDREFEVRAGDVVVVPAGKRFWFRGNLKQVCITAPAWEEKYERHVRDIEL